MRQISRSTILLWLCFRLCKLPVFEVGNGDVDARGAGVIIERPVLTPSSFACVGAGAVNALVCRQS